MDHLPCSGVCIGSLCLNFFHLLARNPNLAKNSIYSNKFFHNFHLSLASGKWVSTETAFDSMQKGKELAYKKISTTFLKNRSCDTEYNHIEIWLSKYFFALYIFQPDTAKKFLWESNLNEISAQPNVIWNGVKPGRKLQIGDSDFHRRRWTTIGMV